MATGCASGGRGVEEGGARGIRVASRADGSWAIGGTLPDLPSGVGADTVLSRVHLIPRRSDNASLLEAILAGSATGAEKACLLAEVVPALPRTWGQELLADGRIEFRSVPPDDYALFVRVERTDIGAYSSPWPLWQHRVYRISRREFVD